MTKRIEHAPEGYFHCAVCNQLFKSPITAEAPPYCSYCGKPSLTVESPEKLRRRASDPPNRKSDSQSRGSRKELRYAAALVTVATMIGSISFYQFYLKGAKSNDVEVSVKDHQKTISYVQARKLLLICENGVNQFLETRESKELFKQSKKHDKLHRQMEKYYTDNPLFVIGEHNASILSWSFIRDAEPFVIGLVAEDEGRQFEMVFIHDVDDLEAYKVDWGFYVRYNEVALRDWVQLNQEAEHEFRLYMRILEIGDNYTLVFYPPSSNEGELLNNSVSVSVNVPVGSDMAKSMMSLLNHDSKVDQDFRNITTKRDPEGYQRVRVKLKKSAERGKKAAIELTEFIANDWYSFDYSDLENL